ncbi:MAG: fasciclin domain-containing protein [Leptodesmis sp.]
MLTDEGSDVAIAVSKGVRVNNSTVTTSNVAADNGVIHLVD